MLLKWLTGRTQPPAPAPTASALDLARAARARGDHDAARAACQEALREEPAHQVEAMALMAALAADQRQFESGLQWVRSALAADPRCVAAFFAHGRLLEGAERFPEAEASYRQATLLDPGHAKAHTNLGCMLHLQGRAEEAVASYRRALALEPDQPEALRNYALIAGGPTELQEATAGFERHLAAHPGDASAQLQLGHLYVSLGRFEQGLARYDQAIALEPEQPEFHFARAQLLLLLGRYPEGWREYEWRWRMETYNGPMRRFPQPRWDGRALEQGTLLVHGETGLGDTFLFVRYAGLAARRCAKVVVECQPALQALVAQVDGVTQAVSQGDPLPPFDAHIPLIALPAVFGTTVDTIPWAGPYIHADAARVRQWAPRVSEAAGRRRRKVGLVWTGDPGNLGNRERSVTLQQLAPLARAPDVAFFSLQKGITPAQRGSPPEGMHFADLTDRIRDFSDTAALLAQLDLLVTVDTSVLHLGGAMGRPTWALLPHSPPWFYHVDRTDEPWYPGMRLFRAPAGAHLDAAVEQMAEALAAWARG